MQEFGLRFKKVAAGTMNTSEYTIPVDGISVLYRNRRCSNPLTKLSSHKRDLSVLRLDTL